MDEVEKKDEDLMQGSGVSPQPMDETKGLFADSMPQLTGREKGPQAVIKFLRYDNCRLQGIEKEYKKILQELSDKKTSIAAKDEKINALEKDLYEKKTFETMQKIFVTLGSTLLGFLSMIHENTIPWLVFLIIGITLVIVGLCYPSKEMFKN